MSSFSRPRIMGIINVTPDSFYEPSRCSAADGAVETALEMEEEGADIIDVGGESTRPGSLGVSAEEQISRVLPVIRGIRRSSAITISVDTQSARVAEAAMDEGANMVNDVSALLTDENMAALCARRDVPVVLMHMRGTPFSMQKNPKYENVFDEVRSELSNSIRRALDAGIKHRNLITDPGIGFGKSPRDNCVLLSKIREFRIESYPVLVGLSRKSFLGHILETDRRALRTRESSAMPESRLAATQAAHAWCLSGGVDILRVHDVQETRDLIAVWEALAWAS